MSDDELDAIRSRVSRAEGYGDDYAMPERDLDALLAEVERLRDRPKHADEAWLARVRERIASPMSMFRTAWGQQAHLDRVALLQSLDATDGVLADLQSEDGPRMHREQGAAEERARIVSVLRDPKRREWLKDGYLDSADVLGYFIDWIKPSPEPSDLLPPAACRAECDRLRAECDRLDAALKRIVNDPELSGYSHANAVGMIAREALGGAE